MSFFLTTKQFIDGTKDVTRRRGWVNLKPGDRFMAVVKGQGLKPGEKIQRLGECECVSNTRESLPQIVHHKNDCAREGFPELLPFQFVEMFCKHMGGGMYQEVSRIEFKKIVKAKGGGK